MQNFSSTSSFSAEIPYSNIFNTRCDICSHPIAQSDINVLQPCFCGPFHGYCITNLELQTRDSQPNNSNPHLRCPRCGQTVTTVNYEFLYDHPQASRPPFTAPIQPQPLLPRAIHDTLPIPSKPLPDFRSTPLYPPPNTPYHQPQTDFTPTAPPASDDGELLPSHKRDYLPPPPKHSHSKQPLSRPPSLQKQHVFNLSPASSAPHTNKHVHLPSPNNAVPLSPPRAKTDERTNSHLHRSSSHSNSPNAVVICRQVSEEDVRNGFYGDDVYKAYVEGKAKVLGPSAPSGSCKGQDKDVNVKVEVDLHLYHHYRPFTRIANSSHHRKSSKQKSKKNTRTEEKTWWKSQRIGSRLEYRDDYHNDDRYRSHVSASRRS